MADRLNFPSNRNDGKLWLTATTADAIEIGDDLYWDSSTYTPRPASSQTDQLTELKNQQLFAQNRIGIAETAKAAGVAGSVLVNVDLNAIHTVTATRATYRAGSFVNVDEAASGTALDPNLWVAVSNRADATAVVVDDSSSARTRIQIRFIRSVFAGNEAGTHLNLGQETNSGATTIGATDPPVSIIDPNGGAVDVTLPAEASSFGHLRIVINTADAAENITLKNDAAGTVLTIGQNEIGVVFCDGTTWRGFTGVL